MQTTNIDMIKNVIETAKFKLAQHKVQGENSTLSIYQVARLMDTVRRGEAVNEDDARTVSFSLN